MPCILQLETSTNVCSVALSIDGAIVFEKVSYEGPSHAALLGVFVEEATAFLKEVNTKPDAVAVSGGPGSFTGLRIGTSMAKGLCMGWGVPLISIPTLEIMAAKAIGCVKDEKSLYCSMLDARRMDVYSCVYDSSLTVVRKIMTDTITAGLFNFLLDNSKVFFFGNGAAKCKEVIISENAIFLDDIYPLAMDMVLLAENAYHIKHFEDLAYFEPFYLKDFIATTPKNKVLGDIKK